MRQAWVGFLVFTMLCIGLIVGVTVAGNGHSGRCTDMLVSQAAGQLDHDTVQNC